MLFNKKSFKEETMDNFREIKEILDDSMGKIETMQEDVGVLKDNINLMIESNLKTQKLLEKVLVKSESGLVHIRKVQ